MAGALNKVVRALVFVLGLVLFIDAVWESPTGWAVIVISLVLMGVISFDQLRELVDHSKRKKED